MANESCALLLLQESGRRRTPEPDEDLRLRSADGGQVRRLPPEELILKQLL